jgi:hypothetical protein
MTHDELLAKINEPDHWFKPFLDIRQALRAVVELHKPTDWYGNDSLVCNYCFGLNYERTGLDMEPESFKYPCITIKAIEKELR